MPQPSAIEELSAKLRQAYNESWARVKAEIRQLELNPSAFSRLHRLRSLEARIVAEMDTIDDLARSWVEGELPKAYRFGGDTMAFELGESFDFTQPHRLAITKIAEDTFSDLLFASQGVRDTTKQLIQHLSRRELLAKMIEGKTIPQSRAAVRKELERRKVFSVRYADGSRHGISEYADMVLRTKSGVAYNAGALNTAKQFGTKFMEVFDGAECGWIGHNDGDHADGSIRPLEECLSVPLSHPNCTRAFGPRPDVVTEGDLKAAQAIAELEAGGRATVSKAAADERRAKSLAQQASRRRSHRAVANRNLRSRAARS